MHWKEKKKNTKKAPVWFKQGVISARTFTSPSRLIPTGIVDGSTVIVTHCSSKKTIVYYKENLLIREFKIFFIKFKCIVYCRKKNVTHATTSQYFVMHQTTCVCVYYKKKYLQSHTRWSQHNKNRVSMMD